MEQSYDHKVGPLAECMLLQRVTLTGISEARLRFLYPHYSRVRGHTNSLFEVSLPCKRAKTPLFSVIVIWLTSTKSVIYSRGVYI
jgi:hypothetical protein